MELCIVRHGETAWNAEGRVQGQIDLPLSEAGHAQARALAAALAGEPFSAVYGSDLARARQTAQPFLDLAKKEIVLDAALRERHYGRFQGLTYAEAGERLPADYARLRARDPDFDLGGGESLLVFQRRVLAFFDSLGARHERESVLVVTHGGVLEMLYRHATGRALSAPRDFGIPNAAINRLALAPAGWTVRGWGDVSHLSAAGLRTA